MKIDISKEEHKVIVDALKFHKSYVIRTLEGIVKIKDIDQETKRSMFNEFEKSNREISQVLNKLG